MGYTLAGISNAQNIATLSPNHGRSLRLLETGPLSFRRTPHLNCVAELIIQHIFQCLPDHQAGVIDIQPPSSEAGLHHNYHLQAAELIVIQRESADNLLPVLGSFFDYIRTWADVCAGQYDCPEPAKIIHRILNNRNSAYSNGGHSIGRSDYRIVIEDHTSFIQLGRMIALIKVAADRKRNSTEQDLPVAEILAQKFETDEHILLVNALTAYKPKANERECLRRVLDKVFPNNNIDLNDPQEDASLPPANTVSLLYAGQMFDHPV